MRRKIPVSETALPALFLILSVLQLMPSGCSTGELTDREVQFVLPGSLVDLSEYAVRRERLMDQIPEGAAIILGATAPSSDYQFVQNHDFFYFSGVEVPNAVLVIDGVNTESVLFFTMEEREARGEGIPVELISNPVEYTGIERNMPLEELAPYLTQLNAQVDVFYTSFRPEELHRTNTNEKYGVLRRTMTENPWDGRLTRELQFAEQLRERFPRVEVKDCSRLIWDLRKIKSEAEVELLRRAGEIGVEAHIALMRSTAVGIPENALAAVFEFACRRAGAQELAYYTIIMSGKNHPFGHYHRYDRILEDGDFVILDAGPDYTYYNADISSSFPANGKFTLRQRELYELANNIRMICLDNYRPGITFRDVGGKVREWLIENGYDPTERRFRGLIRYGGYNHSIGMATHDVQGTFAGPDEVLQPGYVFACDINMPYDEEMGIRLEDTVVITEEGCENLSARLPRTVEEVEAEMRKRGILQMARR